ncbi:Glutathione transport system permease protein GsiC [bioreactor metagenome]|uniref:Glutathione transport system permease protein GsiC n=1 Tax=bioreactor metagenome TaxID=1076179 RepID=A0A644YRL5_9ZZZZ
MLRFIIRRLIQSIPLLFIVSVISFAIIALAPGDPVYMFVSPDKASSQNLDALRQELGLDKSIPERYYKWVTNMIRGDMGNSFAYGKPVKDILFEALPNTIILALAAEIFAFILAVPAGIISAIKRNTAWDYTFSTFSFIGVSLPTFWFGLMLILVFSLKLGWLPTAGMRANYEEFVLMDRIKHLILPTIVLGTAHMASIMRYMRASMMEVINQDYVRTARSKGLTEKIVILKHALRNALIPIITLIGLTIPALFSGAAMTETIFSWPGMGRIVISATFMRDYPVMLGDLVLASVTIIAGSLIADILYAVADPRIRYD